MSSLCSVKWTLFVLCTDSCVCATIVNWEVVVVLSLCDALRPQHAVKTCHKGFCAIAEWKSQLQSVHRLSVVVVSGWNVRVFNRSNVGHAFVHRHPGNGPGHTQFMTNGSCRRVAHRDGWMDRTAYLLTSYVYKLVCYVYSICVYKLMHATADSCIQH